MRVHGLPGAQRRGTSGTHLCSVLSFFRFSCGSRELAGDSFIRPTYRDRAVMTRTALYFGYRLNDAWATWPQRRRASVYWYCSCFLCTSLSRTSLAMESFFVRYRNLLVLLAILLAQIIGLAVQVRRTASGRSTLDVPDEPSVRLIRLWADAVVTPPEQLFHAAKMGAESLWADYLDLRHVREQNKDLQKTIDRLRLEQAALLEDAKQGQRLQSLVDFQEKYIYKTVAAQAIGSSGSDSSRVFYIDKG